MCLLAEPRGVVDRIDTIGLDPLVGVGVPVSNRRLGGSGEIADGLGERDGIVGASPLGVLVGELCLGATVGAGEHGS